MPRPRSSTFYLPLAPIDAPLELKAKLSVLPPSAANALLAPRTTFSRPPHPHPYQQAGCNNTTNTSSSCSSSYSYSNTCAVPKEDECARLNRVLGIPTTTGALNVPSGGGGGPSTGRRRHTDAPKPSFPLTRSPGTTPSNHGRSPLPSSPVPTPAPAHSSSTTDWAVDYSLRSTTATTIATTATITNMPLVPMVTPPQTTDADAEVVNATMVNLVSGAESQSQSQPGEDDNDSEEAIIDADTPRPTTALSGSTTATTTLGLAYSTTMVTGDDDDTEAETSMVWTTTSASPSAHDEGSTPSWNSAFDMDMFAGACDMLNPVVHGRPSTGGGGSIGADVYLQSPPTSRPTTATGASPVMRTRTPIAPIAEEEEETRRAPPPPPQRLSGAPCGMMQVWACRSKIPSRLSEDSSSSSTTPSFSYTASALSDSLHPQDTRHLLRKEFRMAFPPPPAPLPCAVKDLHPREEACLFVEESIPGLADIQASFQTPFPSTIATQQQPVSPPTPTPPPAAAAPRQRFRLAPLYLPKVLRRSLGATTWARTETLRAARAAQRGVGWCASAGDTQWTGNSWLAVGGAGDASAAAAAWWGRIPDVGSGSGTGSSSSGPSSSCGSELVWSGYEDVYSADEDGDGDDDMEGVELKDFEEDEEEEEEEQQRCIWDWDEDEVVEPVRVHGQDQGRHHFHAEAMDAEFVREGAPEPEDPPPHRLYPSSSSSRPEQIHIPPQGTSTTTVYCPEPPTSTGGDAAALGYSMVGKFSWDTTWPTSPTSPEAQTATSFSLAQDAASLSPVTVKMPPVTRRAVRREDGGMEQEGGDEEEEEEEIFRYSPLKLDEAHQDANVDMEVERCTVEDAEHAEYLLHTQSMSSCSTPTATSPSFPPGPLRGVTRSSSFDDGYLDARTPEGEEDEEEFYDADGDAAMEDSESQNATIVSRPHIRAPRPLSLIQHPVLQHQYPAFADATSPVINSVFIIPPSPLTTTAFEAGVGAGSSTPTSATAPAFPGRSHDRFTDRMEEEADLANVGWGASTHILSEKRSYERIVAPRPQRSSRGLEHVINASSPMLRTSSLASPPPSFSSPPPPPSSFASPPPTSSSPRIPSASSPRIGGKAAWAFGSLKSALSNSVSHLVELARSRSPSPLPWLMRGSTTTTTGMTLSGAAAALENSRQASSEELDLERSTSCVTPTPAGGSHSRRSSTTTITGPTIASRHSDSHLPVLKLQVDSTSTDTMMMGESPPPKRTLSTSSLSSLGSEPDSESGSSGGIFSRSPSPEPGSERVWDPSYTLTPRSRPISADAKAAAACGGRLSPMMIPGSWDPEELWAEDGDLAKTW